MRSHTKPRWEYPDTENRLYAGGILFYNEDSFWAIEEKKETKKMTSLIYNDIGGKYTFDDCNIFETIRRELYEETYGMCDVKTSTIKNFTDEYGVKFVMDARKEFSYACVCVPITKICEICNIKEEEIELKFEELKTKAIGQNPLAVYSPLCIKKINLRDIEYEKISYRLRAILKQLF